MLYIILISIIVLSGDALDEGFCDKDGCHISDREVINVVMMIANAHTNLDLQDKFTLTISSMLKHASKHIVLHVFTDKNSRDVISRIAGDHWSLLFTIKFLEMEVTIDKLKDIIEPMQSYFSSKPGSYYSHAFFFLSVALHKILDYDKVIMLDADLKFNSDISRLQELFEDFNDTNLIGVAREAQPVYRHAFNSYRVKHENTRVGQPPPDGLTGFNSGVLLLDLDRMRKSKIYNDLLDVARFSLLAKEFEFKGHLGDQDFYTLVSMKHEAMFYILPCQWNRQLCQWWRNHGYMDVFEEYFRCDGEIHIYHGNCNSNIP